MSTPESTADHAAQRTAWLLDRTEALCRYDTTTGHEDRGLPALRELLQELGADVELQQVEPGRHNVLARWGEPHLLFSTHLDTVPPFLPPTRDGDLLRGRGTCDAKGQITAQLGAIVDLLERGHGNLAWLGVIGEETNSIGADRASALAPHFEACAAVINGEPTQNRLATGQRGSLQLRLESHGVACHSGMPHLGRSAMWPLLDWLQALRTQPTASHPDLGDEIWNLGGIEGGAAPNVVAPFAAADLFVRSLPDSGFEELARRLAPEHTELSRVSYTPPELFDHIDGFEHAIVPFGSDAPRLRRLIGGRRVALCGPGTIEVAHTLDEHITGSDLLRGRDLLVALAETILSEVRS